MRPIHRIGAESGFNPYAAGEKVYGMGRSFPTMGPVDKLGYKERDARHRARRNAMLRRMKAQQKGKDFSADAMKELPNA